MCEAGRVLHHLKHNIEDPRSTMLIVGFQAPDTLGRRLVEHRPEVRILGRTFAVKAEVIALNGLSAHADHGELLRMLGAAGRDGRDRCGWFTASRNGRRRWRRGCGRRGSRTWQYRIAGMQ